MSEPQAPASEMILYRTEDGKTRVQVRFEEETLWLTQAQMADLYQVTPQSISQHLRELFEEGELMEEATCKEFLQVRTEGNRSVSRHVRHYHLRAILAVGFRVRSQRGTEFRRWAGERLNEFLVKGFTMDDERLKNPPGPGVPDYFDEMLERIRDIRASERRMYLRVRDILALAADYDEVDVAEAQRFFQIVQNKLHFSVTGQTAPELITSRANAELPNMGLTSFSGKTVRKSDVTVAKNYLSETEIDELNRIVVMFLDFAEDQARRRKQVFLADWRTKLDEFLRFNERNVLEDNGKISRDRADAHAHTEYRKFEDRRRRAKELEGEAELRALSEKKKV